MKLLPLFLFFSVMGYSQIGGNQLYGRNNNFVQTNTTISSDSTLIINTKVLLNKQPDYYLISVGISQENKTVLEANKNLKNRIYNLKKDLSKIGISNNDIYVDFISQTKIYDHKIEENIVTEFFNGIKIRKNIIIKAKSLDSIDSILNICSKQEIYNIIKVDYVDVDIEKINKLLFDEAIAITKKKKQKFIDNSSKKLSNKYRIASESIQVFYPKKNYKKYDEAFETSEVNTSYSSRKTEKKVRKDKTFYYDSTASDIVIDKVIDSITPIIGIQYLISVTIIYELEK